MGRTALVHHWERCSPCQLLLSLTDAASSGGCLCVQHCAVYYCPDCVGLAPNGQDCCVLLGSCAQSGLSFYIAAPQPILVPFTSAPIVFVVGGFG